MAPACPALHARRSPLVLAALFGLWGLFGLAGCGGTDSADDTLLAGPFDVVFAGGQVLDGSGNPSFRADVGVRDGRIAAIGRLEGAEAGRVVDVSGHMVAPGFIDIHSHADRRLSGEDPRGRAAPSLVAQGVTTLVMNQDGRSPWPLAEQVALLRERGHGPNAIVLVGHGEVRRRAMNDDVDRPATAEEVERMRALVRQGMTEGAWGISTALEYNPGRWSTTDEVAAAVAEVFPGGGIHVSHQRSEGTDPMWYWPSQDGEGPPTLVDAVRETIEIAERTGVPSVASHVKAKGAHYWGASEAVIALIEEARARGVPIYADQYPYETTGSDGSTVLLPGWAFSEGGRRVGEQGSDDRAAAIRAVLADPALAADLRGDVAHEIRRRGGADRVVILSHPNDPELDGASLADVAARWGISPVDAAFRLQEEGDPERRGGVRLRGFSLHDDDIAAYAPHDWMMTASDGGIALPEDGFVHARFYGTFPRKIAHYARDRGVLSVPHAVRSATSLPAQVLGLRDRGMVREGFHADLVVFHPTELQDRATFFEPHQFPDGLPFVMANGVFLVDGGELTGNLPGRVLTPATDRTLPTVP
jgi:N-acyl-D-amino-acid deacylase